MRFFVLLILIASFSTPAFSQGMNACNVFGSIYIESDPQKANVYVYVDEQNDYPDLVVYKVDARLFADKPGFWHMVDTKNFADFKVYFTDRKAFADFTIRFTDTEFFAECNR
jgi:hypothetical protein